MAKLIDAEALWEKINHSGWFDNADRDIALDLVEEAPMMEVIPLSEIYRLIAGKSNYTGDSILAVLTCVAEGKQAKPIKPLGVE